MIKKKARHASVILAGALALCGAAWADPATEAEDQSEAFESDLDRIAAEQGVPATSTTITTKNGMKSAVVGLSSMKMLVVRQNDDGTLTYGHASSEEEAEAFADAESTTEAAEE